VRSGCGGCGGGDHISPVMEVIIKACCWRKWHFVAVGGDCMMGVNL